MSGETLTDASKRLELDAYDQALAVRFRDPFAVAVKRAAKVN